MHTHIRSCQVTTDQIVINGLVIYCIYTLPTLSTLSQHLSETTVGCRILESGYWIEILDTRILDRILELDTGYWMPGCLGAGILASARMVWRPDTPATACVVRRINGVGTLLPTNVEFSTPTVTPLRLNAHCNPAASQHQLSGECVLNAVVNHEGFSMSKSIKINSQR